MKEGMMNKYRFVFAGMIAGAIMAFIFLWTGLNGTAKAGPSQQLADSTPTPASDEGNTSGLSFSVTQSDEIPPSGVPESALAPDFVLPTPVPGETQVYFVPTDNDATATVIYLYNTDNVARVVALRGFNYDGALVYAQNINIAASSFLRLTSDSVAAAPPPSWATPAPITTNFTDFVYFASLSLPHGVKVEGYTIFNPGTGTVDPRKDQGAIPLRFSTDPATVFLPLVNSAP
jgi:hypothetical protein